MLLYINKMPSLTLNKAIFLGILTALPVNTVAAENNINNAGIETTSSQIVKNNSEKNNSSSVGNNLTEHTDDIMTVIAPQVERRAGTITTISASDMQKNGGNDFGSIMRYQPLISATGSSAGSSSGKSGFDRHGYTGYNIRGLESNRVAIDIDGIPLPNATGRSYVGRAGLNTFGIGRDYIDPYLYGRVRIESGATSVERANNALGGTVSFQPKSADDYLSPTQFHYFSYQSDYDSANRSWHNGITAAAGDEVLRGILVISRRDGQQTGNNSSVIAAYPENWYSNSILMSGIWRPNDEHMFTGTVDYYNKTNKNQSDTWNTSGSATIGTSNQISDSNRASISLKDTWIPTNNTVIDSADTRIYYQKSKANDKTDMLRNSTVIDTIYSDYSVKTYGLETQILKTLDNHKITWGLNVQQSQTERPFRQEPARNTPDTIMQPEADSQTIILGGFIQDNIALAINGHNFSVVPGMRMQYKESRPQNLAGLTSTSTIINPTDVDKLYGKKNTNTQGLPSLSFLYDLTPNFTIYLQYKRGAQFPNASQLYGSWNLGSNYAGRGQYALIGNPSLKTETSNNIEWGMKGELTDGVTLNTALFYSSYKKFIANTRYTRRANPEKFVNVPRNIYTIYQAENRDSAFIYGGELSTKINYGTWFSAVNGLSTTFAIGYNKGQSKSNYSGDKYVDLDSIAPMKAVFAVAWDDPEHRYGMAITSTFQKGKQATATNRQTYSNTGSAITDSTIEYMKVPGYGLIDWTGYWQVASHVKLNGGVYNVTNRKYWDYLNSRQLTEVSKQGAYDVALAVQPGRTFQLGVNVDF